MKKSRFTESQIIAVLKEYEAGKKVADVCRTHSISQATFFKWKSKYGGMEQNDLRRLRELEEENARLKKMYADLSLDHSILKDVFQKKGWSPANKK